jgi:predicted transcriptional regulator
VFKKHVSVVFTRIVMGSSGLFGVLLLALLLPYQLLLSNADSIGYGVVQVNSAFSSG